MRSAKKTRRTSPLRILSATIVWIYAAIIAVPLVYLILSSFKTNDEIFSSPLALPREWIWNNYSTAFIQADLGRGLWNSVLITVGAEILTLVLAIPAGYAIARSKGRAGKFLDRTFSLGFLIPSFAVLVPTVLLSAAIGMFRTREFLILFLPATALPLSVILLAQFIRTIPYEIEESAQVDGASRLTILLRIVLPMAVPGIVTVALLNFMSYWNEYIFSLALLGPTKSVRTAQVALPTLITENATQYGVLMAGTVITLIPVYLLYIFMQTRMEEALVQGALKG